MQSQSQSQSQSHIPTFTVITSTFNAAQALPATARSLQSQRGATFEWIIVDGASTDRTVEVAAEFGDLVSVLISEPDAGIYSAWNKALPHIRGKWVLFLGAGDLLSNSEVLARAEALLFDLDERVTLIYGDVLYFYDNPQCTHRLRCDEWAGLKGRWVGGRPLLPCHQGVFQKASLFQDGFTFDERLKISGDNEILLRELIAGNGKKIDMVISLFNADGISAQPRQRLRMVAESIFVNWKLRIFWKRPFYQAYLLLGNFVKYLAMKFR